MEVLCTATASIPTGERPERIWFRPEDACPSCVPLTHHPLRQDSRWDAGTTVATVRNSSLLTAPVRFNAQPIEQQRLAEVLSWRVPPFAWSVRWNDSGTLAGLPQSLQLTFNIPALRKPRMSPKSLDPEHLGSPPPQETFGMNIWHMFENCLNVPKYPRRVSKRR